MTATWKDVYPYLGGAVFNLDSLDALLRQTTAAIATVFQVDCWIWMGLEGDPARPCVYGTGDWQSSSLLPLFKPVTGLPNALPCLQEVTLAEPVLSVAVVGQTVWQRELLELPDWLQQQQQQPQRMQLENGDLVVPVISRWDASLQPFSTERQLGAAGHEVLQMLIQLKRPVETEAALAVELSIPSLNWLVSDLENLEIIASQLSLSYSALYWRYWLEQSRQQAALVGRIAHLLNSTLNADEIVERIVGELGQGFQCDRCILVNLRTPPMTVMAVWDPPDRPLPDFSQRRIERDLWQPIIDLLQGGASYLTLTRSSIEDEETALQDWLTSMQVASVLLIPLFVQSEFLGAVCLLSYQRERQYLIDELQTLRQVADHAAIALTNAQHYQSLWHKQEALRRQNTTLQMEVIRDELTQLMNRRSLERELDQLSTPTLWTGETIFSIVMCDIDYFKLINDTYGHRVGDEVLRGLSARIRQQLRRETPAYRYGGEEFVVILTETPLTIALNVAERLRDAIHSTPIKTAAGAIDVTASFGVAQQDPDRDHHAWDVLQRCDEALYEAKRQGRDRVKSA